jgi:uncharacterized Zn finger protein
VEVLESIGIGSRLQRGRSYARRGQVISVDIGPGVVTAEVQGSRVRPYHVRIGITVFTESEWAKIERALVENALYAASLLSGEMPSDIEEVFDRLGLSLFPGAARELRLDCSCPDVAVPCKHLAATFYLLAEAFDDDPFAILAWRGRDRAGLLQNLAAARAGTRDAGRPERRPQLGECLDSFFVCQADVPAARPPVTPSTALLDQLPQTGLVVRGRPLAEVLRPAYLAFGDDERDATVHATDAGG